MAGLITAGRYHPVHYTPSAVLGSSFVHAELSCLLVRLAAGAECDRAPPAVQREKETKKKEEEEEEGKEKVKAEGPRGREFAASHPAPEAIPTGRWLSALRTGSRDVPCWCLGRAGVQTKKVHQNPTNTTAHDQQLERSRSLGVDTCASRSL